MGGGDFLCHLIEGDALGACNGTFVRFVHPGREDEEATRSDGIDESLRAFEHGGAVLRTIGIEFYRTHCTLEISASQFAHLDTNLHARLCCASGVASSVRYCESHKSFGHWQ